LKLPAARRVKQFALVGLRNPPATVGRGENGARKMPAETPALLKKITGAELGAAPAMGFPC
jgi:hypothetical protein